jgi:protein tyrosine phosphatase
MQNLIRRKFKLFNTSKDENIREIIMLNYLSWPDHGAPETTDYEIIQKLIEFIEEYHGIG